MASRRLWVKRRGAPRWARLLSWIVGAVIWLWIANRFIVQDLPETIGVNNVGAELALDSVFFVVMAAVVAAFAMFLVRLIGRGAAWLKLRFVEGK